jgi:hypothetical protein
MAEFAPDSPLEESGFELLVPVRATREPEAFGLLSEYAAGAEGGDIPDGIGSCSITSNTTSPKARTSFFA